MDLGLFTVFGAGRQEHAFLGGALHFI